MLETLEIIEDFKKECNCGKKHETAVKDVRIFSGAVNSVGKILDENKFSRTLLLVADRTSLAASKGILESLSEYSLEFKLFDDLRVATMELVEAIEGIIANRDIAVISVGTGSLNDICRLAAARQNKDRKSVV